MHTFTRRIGVFFLWLLAVGCSPDPVEIEGFNAYVWKRDKWGCGNERAALVAPVLEARKQLLGLREAAIVQTLGKADEIELYTRNQKFLIYFIEPNLHCTAATELEADAKALHIRLNAMGFSQEIFIKSR